jgi:hypothetical protein
MRHRRSRRRSNITARRVDMRIPRCELCGGYMSYAPEPVGGYYCPSCDMEELELYDLPEGSEVDGA